MAELGRNQRLWFQSPCFSRLTRPSPCWRGHSAWPSELTRHGQYTGGTAHWVETCGVDSMHSKHIARNTLQMLQVLSQSKKKKPISAAHMEQAFYTHKVNTHCPAGLADFLPRSGGPWKYPRYHTHSNSLSPCSLCCLRCFQSTQHK